MGPIFGCVELSTKKPLNVLEDAISRQKVVEDDLGRLGKKLLREVTKYWELTERLAQNQVQWRVRIHLVDHI